MKRLVSFRYLDPAEASKAIYKASIDCETMRELREAHHMDLGDLVVRYGKTVTSALYLYRGFSHLRGQFKIPLVRYPLTEIEEEYAKVMYRFGYVSNLDLYDNFREYRKYVSSNITKIKNDSKFKNSKGACWDRVIYEALKLAYGPGLASDYFQFHGKGPEKSTTDTDFDELELRVIASIHNQENTMGELVTNVPLYEERVLIEGVTADKMSDTDIIRKIQELEATVKNLEAIETKSEKIKDLIEVNKLAIEKIVAYFDAR